MYIFLGRLHIIYIRKLYITSFNMIKLSICIRLNNITFTFNEKDSTNDSKTSTSTEEEEQPDEL